MTTVAQPSNGSRCRGRNRAGLPCQRRAVKDGYCTTHHPTEAQDMKAIGRRGGLVSPQTRLRKSVDDDLRAQARDVLARALAGEDIPKSALDSARSLYSFRSEAPPPPDPTGGAYEGPLMPDGRRPIGLDDVIAFALAHEGTRDAMEHVIAEGRRKALAFAETPPAESFVGVPVRRGTATGELFDPLGRALTVDPLEADAEARLQRERDWRTLTGTTEDE